MKLADPTGRQPKCTACPGLETLFGRAQLAARNLQVAADVHAIEAHGCLDESPVTPYPHLPENFADDGLYIAVLCGGSLGDRLQPLCELRGPGAKDLDRAGHSGAAFSRRMSAPSAESLASIRS